jgi:hypothetical protein
VAQEGLGGVRIELHPGLSLLDGVLVRKKALNEEQLRLVLILSRLNELVPRGEGGYLATVAMFAADEPDLFDGYLSQLDQIGSELSWWMFHWAFACPTGLDEAFNSEECQDAARAGDFKAFVESAFVDDSITDDATAKALVLAAAKAAMRHETDVCHSQALALLKYWDQEPCRE